MSHMTPEEQAAYNEAAARIAQAKRKGWRKLDLSRLRLTAVPDWLRELSQLQWLDLSRNQLTAVPESLADLNQLQYLDLS